MIATGSHANTPTATSANIAPSTSTLSASGSRNAPERGGAVPAGEVAVDAVGAARARTTGRTRPTTGAAVDHDEQHRRQQQAGDGDDVGRRRPAPTARRSGVGRSARHGRSPRPRVHRLGDEVGPERVDDRDGANAPAARSSGTAMMPSISGASRWLRPTPGASTSTSTRRADQLVTSVGGDARPAARAARPAARPSAPSAPAPSRPAA